MELFQKPEVWLILITAASEIIGMSKMKENSVISSCCPSPNPLQNEVANEKILLERLRKAWHEKERRQNRQQLRQKRNQRQEKALYPSVVGYSYSAP